MHGIWHLLIMHLLNSADQNGSCKLKSKLLMAEEYCLLMLRGISYHLEKVRAFFKNFCCIFQRIPSQFVRVLLVAKDLSFPDGTLQLKVTCFFTGWGYFIEQESTMLNSCYILQNLEQCSPFKGRLFFLTDTLHVSKHICDILQGMVRVSCNYFKDI